MRPLAFAGLAAAFALSFSNGLQNAVANGDTRSISLKHVHTEETVTVVFKREGRYEPKALEQLNWLLRDWRRDEPTKMDPQLFDLLWEVYRETGATEPINIISAYRSPQTNAMLRRRGRGVARFSQHMMGRAIDFYIPGVELPDLRVAGLRLQRGGVGFYPTSGSPFVHVDTGGVRHWPRMTRDQLARVFPTGRTVHIPADGKPMAGFELAAVDLEKRGSKLSQVALASRTDTPTQQADLALDGGKVKRMISSLLGQRDEEEEETPARTVRSRLPVATTLTAGPPLPGSTPPPAVTAPRPTALAALAPTLPSERSLKWQQGPAPATVPTAAPTPGALPVAMLAPTPVSLPVATPAPIPPIQVAQAQVPLPRPRPADIEVTASLPEAIIGKPTREQVAALAYAPAQGPLGTSKLPPVATPTVLAAQLSQQVRAGDPARPTGDLLSTTMVQYVAELYHPNLFATGGLLQPVRAALRVSFDHNLALAPHATRFAGPAVAALPVVAFERGFFGSLLAKMN